MQRKLVASTCLAVLAASAACGVRGSGSDAQPPRQTAETRVLDNEGPDRSEKDASGRTGPLPEGGSASCVESYAPEALRRRAFAFDGVVVGLGPSVSDRGDGGDLGLPGVTFEVREWFSGGAASTVTVDLQPPTTASATSSDPGYAYDIGSRLLISGEARWGGLPSDDPIAWGCGFSRYYDVETATAWRDALQAP